MRVLKIIFIISILLSFFLFINTTDLGKAASSLYLVGGNFIFLILLTFIAYLSASIGWRYCFGKEGKMLSVFNLFIIRHVGETISLINPVGIIGGEAVKVLLLNNKGIEKKMVITSVLISRILMAATQIILFLFATTFIAKGFTGLDFRSPRLSAMFIPFTIVILSGVAIYMGRHPFIRIVEKTTLYSSLKKRTINWRVRLNEIWKGTFLFFADNKKAVAWSSLFFALHWVIGSLEFFFILKFLGIKVSIAEALFLDMGVVLFKSAGTFIPAQIGIEEYGNKIMLSLIGVAGADIWITVSLLRRLRQLFWIVAGLGLYLLINKKHRSVPLAPDGNIICQS